VYKKETIEFNMCYPIVQKWG